MYHPSCQNIQFIQNLQLSNQKKKKKFSSYHMIEIINIFIYFVDPIKQKEAYQSKIF